MRRQVAGLNHHRRRHLVDGEVLTTTHHRSNHPKPYRSGTKMAGSDRKGPLRLPERQLWPPLALGGGPHHRPQQARSGLLPAATRRLRCPAGRVSTPGRHQHDDAGGPYHGSLSPSSRHSRPEDERNLLSRPPQALPATFGDRGRRHREETGDSGGDEIDEGGQRRCARCSPGARRGRRGGNSLQFSSYKQKHLTPCSSLHCIKGHISGLLGLRE
jgi:hypothetical protein